ncbi:hypothetical protein [Hoeflea ulvae]|uniref:Uncharacterized protein n=1 Tax=Hoeflea ulvae TaxID=2983764 RepID=A0ABT3YC08_9HYPH|nr:hypothetical protein [Hoeflea ulvae]MCY0093412.1 hypothetical protein [Hoeflea ulvae]
MSDEMEFNFVNKASGDGAPDVVINQCNQPGMNFTELIIAWTVIRNCGTGFSQGFSLPASLDISAADSRGNETPPQTVGDGQALELVGDASGNILRLAGTGAASPNEVEFRNNLPQGSVDALVYKDHRLLAKQTGIAPGQKAAFSFPPQIFIGVVPGIQEGAEIPAAIMEQAMSRIDLSGVRRADIVMTDGRRGADASPYAFHLENVET